MAASIPRFLLPRRRAIWTSITIRSSTAAKSIRNASRKAAPKQNSPPNPKTTTPQTPVLAKPARFNPPSHGARLRKAPPRYPGPPLSSDQAKEQQTKKYPNMMPPKGTFMHWFLNDRSIHLYITLGTLFSLAGYASVTHFKRTSKFGDMLPPAADLFFHPVDFVRTCVEVLRLHTAHVSAETAEKRRRAVDDVEKRSVYRKVHGLETDGFGGWTAKVDTEELDPRVSTGAENSAAVVAPMGDGHIDGEQMEEQEQKRKRPLKMWFGIW